MTDTEKLRKAAFLLGLATGSLLSAKEKYPDLELGETLATLNSGIDELFYRSTEYCEHSGA